MCPLLSPLFLVVLLIFLTTTFHSALAAVSITTSKKATKVTKTLSGRIEMCLSCHHERPDKAHGRDVLGCSVCHLGNPLAGTPFEAHKGMILNPGDLRVAQKTCGQEGCHVEQVKDIKNTLMSTNRGIISTLRYYWGETDDNNHALTVEDLIKPDHPQSLALDYFRKLCGTCHLWLPRNSMPGFIAEKGGGCTACHNKKPKVAPGKKGERHPYITRDIPMENCVRCHNRSGRIGLSYQGLYESEGYGTPYEDGELSAQELPDGRFVQKIQPDIHYEKGLVCIDCHSQKELMGDGRQRAHFYQQVEVRCTTCHGGQQTLKKLLAYQESKKKFPMLNNLVAAPGGTIALKGKHDGKLHPLKPFSEAKCRNQQHENLSCQACHSPWVPQCYGCHVRYQRGEKQLDKLSLKETFGNWKEFRSYMRFESPVLGVLKDEKGHEASPEVVILVPG
ncbi:MAG: hypothetical protein GXO58_06255 [Thermodesulfobacteria bacterium]|nr:hypothetical protein [Thermodesulfobacteriota bacterium]